MNRNNRARRAAAMVATLGILVQPSAHLIAVVTAQAPPAPPATTAKPQRPPPSRRQRSRPTTKPPRPPSRPHPAVDGGWPRLYDLPSGGSMLVYQPQIATWDKQTHMVAFSAVSLSRQGRRQAGARDDQARSRHEGRGRRSPGQLPEHEDRRGELPDPAEGAGAGDRHRRSTTAIPDDERVIALDRVLANVDKSQHRPEERRRHQGRSADDLLQQDAGGDREPRRRSDLEPDQGERSQVRGEHELGSVPDTSRRTPTTCATTTRG